MSIINNLFLSVYLGKTLVLTSKFALLKSRHRLTNDAQNKVRYT